MLWAIILAFFVGSTLGFLLASILISSKLREEAYSSGEPFNSKPTARVHREVVNFPKAESTNPKNPDPERE